MGVTVLDAGVVIAGLDADDAHHTAAAGALTAARDRGDSFVVPASAYAEVLVRPAARGNATVARVDAALDAMAITIADADREIAVAAPHRCEPVIRAFAYPTRSSSPRRSSSLPTTCSRPTDAGKPYDASASAIVSPSSDSHEVSRVTIPRPEGAADVIGRSNEARHSRPTSRGAEAPLLHRIRRHAARGAKGAGVTELSGAISLEVRQGELAFSRRRATGEERIVVLVEVNEATSGIVLTVRQQRSVDPDELAPTHAHWASTVGRACNSGGWLWGVQRIRCRVHPLEDSVADFVDGGVEVGDDFVQSSAHALVELLAAEYRGEVQP